MQAKWQVKCLRSLGLAALLGALAPQVARSEEPSAATESAPPVAPAKPALSDALLQPTYAWDITGAHFSILRGGSLLNDSLTAEGLSLALRRSPLAEKLAREAHQRLVLGNALYYAGFGGVLAGVVGVTVGAAQVTDSRAQWGFGTAGAIVAAAGLVSLVAGLFAINDGLAKVLAAVNAYNVDLVQGLPLDR